MKKITTGLAAALLLAASATGSADAASVERIHRTRGHGPAPCPSDAFCLYERTDYNGGTDGDIWVFQHRKGALFTGRVNLAMKNAQDFGRSAIANDRTFGTVSLSPDGCHRAHDLRYDWEELSFYPGAPGPERRDRHPDLNGRKGLRHDADARDPATGRQLTYAKELNLNDRARCLMFDEPTPGRSG
ncbi:hypothetical protein ACWEQL_21060 [Kitasatospora sp. NPDC004240]